MPNTTRTTTTASQPALFETKIRNIPDLKRLIRLLDNLVDESPVTVNEEGLRFRAADPSTVGLMDLLLKPEAFTRFQPPEDELLFTINVDELKDKVTEATKSDDLTLSVTRRSGEQPPSVQVTVWSGGVESTFSLSASTVDEDDQPDTQAFEFDGSAVVATEKLSKAINRMGDSAALSLTENCLRFESSEERGSTEVAFSEASDHLHAVTLDADEVQSLYSTDYLDNVTQLKQVAKRAELAFSDDFPLRITASNSWFRFEYTVAPRIEEG